MPARVLVAEDHTLVAEGFRRILEQVFDVVGIVGDGQSLVAEALRLQPDILLVDISLPLLDGFEAARRITRDWPDAKVLFLTMHSDVTYLQHAIEAGAHGYVLKAAAGEELVNAVNEVLNGRKYFDPRLLAQVPDKQRTPTSRATGLTDRQTEILRLIATGQSNDEIAVALGIASRTVKFHRAQIEKKLGLSGTAALTRYAIGHGLATSE